MARTIAIVQARVGSTRLPGKILKPINGKPAIYWVMARTAAASKVDKVILATSKNPENDILANLAKIEGWNIYRGNEDDVVSRFIDVAEIEEPKMVVRVCADNFAIDPDVIDKTIEHVQQKNLDICNPFLDHQYPFGAGAEVATTACLKRVGHTTRDQDPKYREHVFFWAYDHPELFRISGLQAPATSNRPKISISVDTDDDLTRLKKIYQALRGSETSFRTPELIQAWDELGLTVPAMAANI